MIDLFVLLSMLFDYISLKGNILHIYEVIIILAFMLVIHIDEENLVTKPIITFSENRIMDKIRKLHVMNHFCLPFYN